MPECPDCHSKDAASKGYSPYGKKRYICKNCKRNYTEQIEKIPMSLPDSVLIQMSKTDTCDEMIREEIDIAKGRTMTTIQVSEDIKHWIESLKLCKQESNNNVLIRLKNKA